MARPKNTQNIGKYDHKGKCNTSAIIKNAKQYGQEIEQYKMYAAARNKNRRYDVFEITRVINNIIDYITSCIDSGQPATIAKLILSSGSNKDFFYFSSLSTEKELLISLVNE